MAWNLVTPSPPIPPAPLPPRQPQLRGLALPTPRCRRRRAARSRGPGLSKFLSGRRGIRAIVSAALPEEVAEDTTAHGGSSSSSGSTVSSVRTQLDLLDQLTSGGEDESGPTIREQLTELVEGRVDDFSIPLGKRLKASINSLTISQQRNIKRQAYLNEVSERNDSQFFATIGAFVLLPPAIILAVAILTGYVQLFP